MLPHHASVGPKAGTLSVKKDTVASAETACKDQISKKSSEQINSSLKKYQSGPVGVASFFSHNEKQSIKARSHETSSGSGRVDSQRLGQSLTLEVPVISVNLFYCCSPTYACF